jgi:hypothetical protein
VDHGLGPFHEGVQRRGVADIARNDLDVQSLQPAGNVRTPDQGANPTPGGEKRFGHVAADESGAPREGDEAARLQSGPSLL